MILKCLYLQDDLRKDARLMEFNSLVNKVPFMYCVYVYSCMSIKTAEESSWWVNLASVVLAVRIMKPCTYSYLKNA